jgi:hypothetical protein
MYEDIKYLRAFSSRVLNNHCWYCGQKMYKRGWNKAEQVFIQSTAYTLDHIVPKSKGGGYRENIVPSCEGCNRLKSNLSLEEFRIVFFGAHIKKFWGENAVKMLKDGGNPFHPALMKGSLCLTVSST